MGVGQRERETTEHRSRGDSKSGQFPVAVQNSGHQGLLMRKGRPPRTRPVMGPWSSAAPGVTAHRGCPGPTARPTSREAGAFTSQGTEEPHQADSPAAWARAGPLLPGSQCRGQGHGPTAIVSAATKPALQIPTVWDRVDERLEKGGEGGERWATAGEGRGKEALVKLEGAVQAGLGLVRLWLRGGRTSGART